MSVETITDRPGDVAHERQVDHAVTDNARRYEEQQALKDAEMVYMIVVRNTRTGAKLHFNTRDVGGWYQTEDGFFLVIQEAILSIIDRWTVADESRTVTKMITGLDFRLAHERAA